MRRRREKRRPRATPIKVVHPGDRPVPSEPPPIPADPRADFTAQQLARLPNLIVIGAGKCGTSALHSYLARHPEIGMSRRKEQQLFGATNWLTRLPLYPRVFDGQKSVRGESSPSYSIDPFVPCVPEQIAAVLSEPRFIYLVADPVARVVAHWAEQHVLRFDRRSLAEALDDAANPLNPYVAASRFGHQLQRYVDVFGRDRVLVLDQVDLRMRRRETMRRAFEFLGVDADFWTDDFHLEANTADTKLMPNRVGGWIEDRIGIRSPLPVPLSRIPFVTAQPFRRPPLDIDLRDRLVEVLAPDAAHFRRLVKLPFAHWDL